MRAQNREKSGAKNETQNEARSRAGAMKTLCRVRAVSEEEQPPVPAAIVLRPAQCRTYLRNLLAERFPVIADAFVKQAEAGSCQHLKLVTQLLEPPKKASRAKPRKGVLQLWHEQLEREHPRKS